LDAAEAVIKPDPSSKVTNIPQLVTLLILNTMRFSTVFVFAAAVLAAPRPGPEAEPEAAPKAQIGFTWE
jgi:hypothetical protein